MNAFLGISPPLRGVPAIAVIAALLMVPILFWPWLLLPIPTVLVAILLLRSIGFLRFLSLSRNELTVAASGQFTPRPLLVIAGGMILTAMAAHLAAATAFYLLDLGHPLRGVLSDISTLFPAILLITSSIDTNGFVSMLMLSSTIGFLYFLLFILLLLVCNGSILYYCTAVSDVRSIIILIMLALFMVGLEAHLHLNSEPTPEQAVFFDARKTYDDYHIISVGFYVFNSIVAAIFPLFLFLLFFGLPRFIYERTSKRSPDVNSPAR